MRHIHQGPAEEIRQVIELAEGGTATVGATFAGAGWHSLSQASRTGRDETSSRASRVPAARTRPKKSRTAGDT